MAEQEEGKVKAVPGWAKQSRVMIGSLLAAGIGFACTLPTWIRAEVTTVISTHVIDISGAKAASTVSALALVAIVASVTLGIAGALLRKTLAVLMSLAGCGMALASLTVQASPETAAAAQVSAVTGTTAAANSYQLTAMPWLGLLAGLLVALCGIWSFGASSQWKKSQKYDRSIRRDPQVMPEENPDEIDTWDSLTAGEDPTDR